MIMFCSTILLREEVLLRSLNCQNMKKSPCLMIFNSKSSCYMFQLPFRFLFSSVFALCIVNEIIRPVKEQEII